MEAVDLHFRPAAASDAPAVAALHADSWRRHYRGIYADAYLDGAVSDERLMFWTERLEHPDDRGQTLLAEDHSGLVGFAYTVFGDDPGWGALLDNLHVTHRLKGQGVGSRLLALSARAVAEQGTGLYLWVLEENTGARAFYDARGGRCVERRELRAAPGEPSRYNSVPIVLRYAWSRKSLPLGAT